MEQVAELRAGGGPRVIFGRITRSYPAALTAITAAGLFARLAWLGLQPLWRDEAFTAVVVRRPLGAMLDAVRADSAPPLVYLIDHVITSVWSSAVALRLLPALAGAAAIPLAAALGRRIARERGGLLAAALVAVAPAMVLSARDARMYAVAATLILASTLLLVRAVEKPSLRRFAAYAAISCLALYTDYFALLAVAGQLAALVLLRTGRRAVIAATLAAAAAVLTLAPWVVAAWGQLSHAGASFWVQPVSFTTVSGELVQFFSGPPVDPGVPGRVPLLVSQGFAVAAGVLALAALVARWRTLPRLGRYVARLCALSGLGALALLVAVSVWKPLVDGRYISVVWGPLLVLVATGLAVVERRRLVAAALGITAICSCALAVAPSHPATPAAIERLEDRLRPGDFVAAHPSQYLLFLYYGDAPLLQRTHVVSGAVPWFWGTAAYPPGAVVPAVPDHVAAQLGRVFYAYGPGEGRIQLPAAYVQRGVECWTGVCVAEFDSQSSG